MAPIAVMTVLCTAGVAFYVRFLVALCKECKPSLSGYWLRTQPRSDGDEVVELHEQEYPVSRAA